MKQEEIVEIISEWRSALLEMEKNKDAQIAGLLDLLSDVHNFSPAGSGSIPQWLETRTKVSQTLEKYGK